LSGVADAAVMSGKQRFDEGIFDATDFAHLQIAFVKLSVKQSLHDDFVHKRLNSFGCGVFQGSAGAFDGWGLGPG